MFICAHCPYVKHIEAGLAALGLDYLGKPVSIVAISSNDATTHPTDAPDGLKRQAETYGFNFPYLYDETQSVARAYKAACTPDFFLFDRDFRLVYRGQFDSSRPGNGVPVTGKDLRAALDAVVEDKPQIVDQRPSMDAISSGWRRPSQRQPLQVFAEFVAELRRLSANSTVACNIPNLSPASYRLPRMYSHIPFLPQVEP